MYIAKVNGEIVLEGDVIDINGVSSLVFNVIGITPKQFKVRWATGAIKGRIEYMPLHIFGDVEVIEVSDDSRDPNISFLLRRLKDDH